ncbi:MAG: toll/interleukin-1 receptor domain-containing protein [Pseudomonadota bacterium]
MFAISTAKAIAPKSEKLASRELSGVVERGSCVDLFLDGAGSIQPSHSSIVWEGELITLVFLVTIPEDASLGTQCGYTLRIASDSMPLGRVDFQIQIDDENTKRVAVNDMKRYRTVFVSYASKDRLEVLKRVEGMDDPETDVFIDVDRLESGSKFDDDLFTEIANRDVFALFWTDHAASSAWVGNEVEFAAKMERERGTPDIWPKALRLPIPPPPECLSDKHFSSRWARMILAEETLLNRKD